MQNATSLFIKELCTKYFINYYDHYNHFNYHFNFAFDAYPYNNITFELQNNIRHFK